MASSLVKYTAASGSLSLVSGPAVEVEEMPRAALKSKAVAEERKIFRKQRMEKDMPPMETPKVPLSSFVGLEELKEELMDTVGEWDRLLVFGPTGCGKSHFARALTTELKAMLLSVEKTTFHSWGQSLRAFTQLFADVAKEKRAEMVVLLLDNFDWFYSSEQEKEAVIRFLQEVERLWKNVSELKLIVIGCSYTPWNLDKEVVECFQKRVYLRPLNTPERRRLIEKKSSEMLHRVGLDMSEKDLADVVKRVERMAGWEICEMVEKAFRLQCPAHIKRHAWLCANLRPFNKTDFEVTLDRMTTTGTNDKKLVAKFQEFNQTFGDRRSTAVPKFENKATQVEEICRVKKRHDNHGFSKFFGRIDNIIF